MANNRLLIDYLPHFMRDFREMKEIMSAEQVEIDNAYKVCDDAMDEQFIATMSEYGASRYEKSLGIIPKATDTIEERRFRIFATMNQDLPYTMTKLNEMLTTICGVGNFEINLQAEKYHIEIKLALTNQNNYQQVVDLLKYVVPANMTRHVQIMYNRHSTWSHMKHGELRSQEYTHDILRNEVINNG